MGIHICLVNDEEDHPDWDFLRVQNDREFPNLIDWDKVVYKNSDDGESYFRPINIDELKEKINSMGWENKNRYLHLINLIENNQDFWLYFSY